MKIDDVAQAYFPSNDPEKSLEMLKSYFSQYPQLFVFLFFDKINYGCQMWFEDYQVNMIIKELGLPRGGFKE